MALISNIEETDNPVVYFLAPNVMTDYAFKDIGREIEDIGRVLYPGEDQTDLWIANLMSQNTLIPESPISLLPAYSEQRIISQKSCFTLFGSRLNGFVKDNKQITCICCDKKILHKVIIDGNSKENLLNELATIGISSETIYPGLEGLVKDINKEIFGKK